MKTFEEFIVEGKNKERQRLLAAYDRGRMEGDTHTQISTQHIEPMTPEQVLKNSGRRAVLDRLKTQDKAAAKRRKDAVKGILKKYSSLKETIISYPMARPATVYDNGKKKHLPKGKAMAKRSSSSSGGNGD